MSYSIHSDPGTEAPIMRPALVLAHAREKWRWKRAFLPEDLTTVRLGREGDLFSSTLARDRRVSREHARIVFREGRWWLVDLDSLNGTWLNGRAIEGTRPLSPGDVIRLGYTLMVFELDCPVEVEPLEGWVGHSGLILHTQQQLRSCSQQGETILLLGELGTGAQLAARTLHRIWGNVGPLVSMHCELLSRPQFSDTLLSPHHQFLGELRGSPSRMLGVAQEGTLFLESLEVMPPDLQQRLVRLLQGGDPSEPSPRVVLWTSHEPSQLVSDGELQYELSQILHSRQLRLPPLRLRRGDIPLLARTYLQKQGLLKRGSETHLAEALLMHSYPSNVRGLYNLLSISAVSSGPLGPLRYTSEVESALQSVYDHDDQPGAPSREALVDALERFEGRMITVERHLQCSKRELRRLMEQYDLEPQSFWPENSWGTSPPGYS